MANFKTTPPKERMGALGAAWKVLNETEKKVYQDMADEANKSLGL